MCAVNLPLENTCFCNTRRLTFLKEETSLKSVTFYRQRCQPKRKLERKRARERARALDITKQVTVQLFHVFGCPFQFLARAVQKESRTKNVLQGTTEEKTAQQE